MSGKRSVRETILRRAGAGCIVSPGRAPWGDLRDKGRGGASGAAGGGAGGGGKGAGGGDGHAGTDRPAVERPREAGGAGAQGPGSRRGAGSPGAGEGRGTGPGGDGDPPG